MATVNEELPEVIYFAFKNDLAMLANRGGTRLRLRSCRHNSTSDVCLSKTRCLFKPREAASIQVSQDAKKLYNVRRQGLDEVSI
jgi:hypothetical protein